MKTRLLIIGIGLLAFGLVNLLSYLPISFGIVLMNSPFPFQHLRSAIPKHGGTYVEIGYLAAEEAITDPYWLAWSLALYAGIGIIVFAIWRIRK